MIEKEAEEYANQSCFTEMLNPSLSESIDISDDIKEAVLFGYNKANEWHYPSKGEIPKEDTAEKETLYLLCFGLDNSDYTTGVFSHGRFWCFDSGWFETNEVIAWKEIVLPKMIKE